VKIVEVRDPTPIIPGAYLPGKIQQVTEYEKIASNFLATKGNEFVQETLTLFQSYVIELHQENDICNESNLILGIRFRFPRHWRSQRSDLKIL